MARLWNAFAGLFIERFPWFALRGLQIALAGAFNGV